MIEKKIIIIEPGFIVQEGLRLILSSTNGFVVRHCFSTIEQMRLHPYANDADLFIINPTLLDLHHHNSVRQQLGIKNEIPIVALIYSFIDHNIVQQFDAEITIHDSAVQIANKLVALKRDNKNENEELSEREKEILIAVAKGMSNKEIADSHFISIHTVITHRKNIVKKTGIKSVSGLTAYALVNNLISFEEIDN